jgi:hypothetical protein
MSRLRLSLRPCDRLHADHAKPLSGANISKVATYPAEDPHTKGAVSPFGTWSL